MSHKVNIGYCHACDDHIDGPASLLFLADTLMRAHLEVCDAVDARVAILIAETEQHLEAEAERCPHIRIVNGHTFRCRHTISKCRGMHDMVRADGAI